MPPGHHQCPRGRTVRWGWQQEPPGCQLRTGFTNATRGGLATARTQRSGGTGAPHLGHQEGPGRAMGEKGCCRLSLREARSPWRAQDRPAAGRGDPSFGGCHRGIPADVQAVCLLQNGAIHFLERSGALGGIEMRIWCCGGRERVQPSGFFTVSAEWSHGARRPGRGRPPRFLCFLLILLPAPRVDGNSRSRL